MGGAIGLGDYLEAGSIVFLFTLADWLESRSGDKVSIRSMEGHRLEYFLIRSFSFLPATRSIVSFLKK